LRKERGQESLGRPCIPSFPLLFRYQCTVRSTARKPLPNVLDYIPCVHTSPPLPGICPSPHLRSLRLFCEAAYVPAHRAHPCQHVLDRITTCIHLVCLSQRPLPPSLQPLSVSSSQRIAPLCGGRASPAPFTNRPARALWTAPSNQTRRSTTRLGI